MEKRGLLTKNLALTGTMFVWIPILAPAFFSVSRLFIRGKLGPFDYLMPAELFPLALLGGALLLWVSLKTHLYRRLIGWGVGIAVFVLLAGMVLAAVTGLASGEIEPTGIWWTLVTASLAVYVLALVAAGIGGILLLRDLFMTKNIKPDIQV
jgi:hypothetical protein